MLRSNTFVNSIKRQDQTKDQKPVRVKFVYLDHVIYLKSKKFKAACFAYFEDLIKLNIFVYKTEFDFGTLFLCLLTYLLRFMDKIE